MGITARDDEMVCLDESVRNMKRQGRHNGI